MNKKIYLDHNASTPLFPPLHPQLEEWIHVWGNPSSIHWAGRQSKKLLRESRLHLANWVDSHPDEIIFTSGGSEANNLALRGSLQSLSSSPSFRSQKRSGLSKKNSSSAPPSPHWPDTPPSALKGLNLLVSAVEHPSVLETAKDLESKGVNVDVIPVQPRKGDIDLNVYQQKLKENPPHLVSIMLANNETGHIFPIKKMAAMAHDVGAIFHCDAIQALGKIPFSLKSLHVDLASFSGHKFYALKGVGFLYLKKNTSLNPLFYGGKQERGYRPGTENILAIASMGALAKFKEDIQQQHKNLQKIRDNMEEEIQNNIPHTLIVGQDSKRLPNTSNILFHNVNSESLLMSLDLKGFALSARSACHSGASKPSPVLLSMGFNEKEASSSLRISLGWGTKEEDVKSFIKTLTKEVNHLRSVSPSTTTFSSPSLS